MNSIGLFFTVHKKAMSKGKFGDKILYQRLKRKDKDAFIKSYDLYLNDIYRFIYFKVSNREEAEDLTSQTFLKTWNYIQDGNLNEYGSLKSLLYRVARNLVIDYYREKSRKNTISLDNYEKADSLLDEKQNIKKIAELSSDMNRIYAMIKELKDEYREVIVMRYINELSIGEIADTMDKSNGNIRVMIYRALKILREMEKEK